MEWPLHDRPIPTNDVPVFNAYYRDAGPVPCDPTMVWGADVLMGPFESALKEANRQSQVILTPAHALLKATGMALARMPIFNRRLISRKIYEFKAANLLISIQNVRERRADVVLVRNADSKSVEEIARDLWAASQTAAHGSGRYDSHASFYRRLPLWLSRWLFQLNVYLLNHWNLPAGEYNERQRCSPVLVNYLGGAGMATMRSYKPSRLPFESYTLNVTMGRTEDRPVAEKGAVVVRRVAPVNVRADHRIVDALELGRFVQTIVGFFEKPETLLAGPVGADSQTPATDRAGASQGAGSR